MRDLDPTVKAHVGTLIEKARELVYEASDPLPRESQEFKDLLDVHEGLGDILARVLRWECAGCPPNEKGPTHA